MGCGSSKSGPHIQSNRGAALDAGVDHHDEDVIDANYGPNGQHTNHETNKDEKEDDDHHHQHRDDALACPGSPSFRVYCTDHSPMEDTPYNAHDDNILRDDDFDAHEGPNREINKGSSDEVEFEKKESKGRSITSGIRNVLAKRRGKQAK